MPNRKPRIAIVGGGPAGLSAAFHLVRDGDWTERFESITVYQLGWRLGGKGATGREAACGWRITEHGIHGFCNFYWNTFRMMKKVYEGLSPEHRAWLPLQDLEDAFPPSSLTLGVEEVRGGRLRGSRGTMPNSPGRPWDGSWLRWTPKRLIERILEQMKRRWRSGEISLIELDSQDLVADGVGGAGGLEEARRAADEIDAAIAQRLTALEVAVEDHESFFRLTQEWDEFDQWVRSRAAVLHERARRFADSEAGTIEALRAVTSLQLYAALLRGVLADGVLAPGFDLDDLDGVDYRSWLACYGASQAVLDSPSAFSVAHILFAYPNGDSSRPPELSTAAWLNWILRSLVGRGEYFYFLGAGTGETVILPLYLFLKQKGVRFELFHKLVGVTSVGDALDALAFEVQAKPKPGTEYDPLEILPGTTTRVWPATPIWSRLDAPDQTADLEAWDVAGGAPREELRRGKDFDYVVWALPPTMIAELGDEALRTRWAQPASMRTTATAAAQIWLSEDTDRLGWQRQSRTERYASASFPNPLNGMVAFDDLVRFESWPPNGPKGLFYLCGQHATTGPIPESQRPAERQRVRRSALATLARMGDLMGPHARDPVDPRALRADLLYCPSAPPRAHPIDCQYIRVNTRPTEAYVQAPAGSASLRLFAWSTSYDNVVVAGDWIYTGFNLGSFESAVTGGALAAFALAGTPDVDEIEGFAFIHPRAAQAAAAAKNDGVVPKIR